MPEVLRGVVRSIWTSMCQWRRQRFDKVQSTLSKHKPKNFLIIAGRSSPHCPPMKSSSPANPVYGNAKGHASIGGEPNLTPVLSGTLAFFLPKFKQNCCQSTPKRLARRRRLCLGWQDSHRSHQLCGSVTTHLGLTHSDSTVSAVQRRKFLIFTTKQKIYIW